MSDKHDRRSLRSRRALWEALMSLLQEKDWGEINVQMICARADVVRSTFYAHFQTKQDLLDAGFAEGLNKVGAVIPAALQRGEDLAVIDWLTDHLAGAAGFHGRLRGSPAGFAIMSRFRRKIGGLIGDDLRRRGITLSEGELEFVTGGVFAVTEAWLERGCDANAGLLAHRLKDMVGRISREAR